MEERIEPEIVREVRAWCADNLRNPAVLRWLRKNPKPAEYPGTAMQWAFWFGPQFGV